MNRTIWQFRCIRGQSGNFRNTREPGTFTSFHSTAGIQGEIMLLKKALRVPVFSCGVLALCLVALAVPGSIFAQQPSGAGASSSSSAKLDSPQPKQEPPQQPGGSGKGFIGY